MFTQTIMHDVFPVHAQSDIISWYNYFNHDHNIRNYYIIGETLSLGDFILLAYI